MRIVAGLLNSEQFGTAVREFILEKWSREGHLTELEKSLCKLADTDLVPAESGETITR